MYAVIPRLRRWFHLMAGLFSVLWLDGKVAHRAETYNKGLLVCDRWFVPLYTEHVRCACGRKWK